MKVHLERAFLAIFLATALGSCSKGVVRPSEDRYRVVVVDNTKEERFDISLVSNDVRPFCLSIENWPNSSGTFTVEQSDVFLETSRGVLPVRSPLMSVYCPGGCGQHRVEPNGELHGFIMYSAFGDPLELAADTSKRLRFNIFPFYCRNSK
jgi:hypothetical protein